MLPCWTRLRSLEAWWIRIMALDFLDKGRTGNHRVEFFLNWFRLRHIYLNRFHSYHWVDLRQIIQGLFHDFSCLLNFGLILVLRFWLWFRRHHWFSENLLLRGSVIRLAISSLSRGLTLQWSLLSNALGHIGFILLKRRINYGIFGREIEAGFVNIFWGVNYSFAFFVTSSTFAWALAY